MPKGRQTCTECSMRRQKCDREQPCGRCVKRGQADKCTTDWGPRGYDPKVHRVYPRSENAKSAVSRNNDDTTQFNEPSDTTPAHQRQDRTSVSLSLPSIVNSPLAPISQEQPQSSEPNQTPGSLDVLLFGKAPLGDYDPRLRSVQLIDDAHIHNGMREAGEEIGMMGNSFGGTGPAQISFLQLLLPSKRQIFQLVEYQIEHLLWYHMCFHGATFHAELTAATAGSAGLQIKSTDLRWVALLFSIMASSMFSVSESLALSWGFHRDERAKLTRQWFKCCVTCLNLADYMRCHHVYSIQAIGILTQSAHILGFSNTQSALLGAALKIAQGLGLQRLGLDEDEPAAATQTTLFVTEAQRHKIIQREVGRRLWAQLCIQDWFQIAFSEMYSINPLHFQTLKPTNMDDSTLRVYPDDVPTGVGFANFLYDIAMLMPQSHDAILSSNTLYTKYERVLECDAKLRQLVTDRCPKYLNIMEPVDATWPMWIPWARRSAMLCYHHKIIMVHRPFLGRSFTEPTFAFSRRACLAASKGILKEAKTAYDEEGPALWIDQAFMVAAGITLALDLFHRRDGEPELDEHRKMVETTISMLGKYDSMIGLRGCRMLASLLAEQAKVCASNQLGSNNNNNNNSNSKSKNRKHGLDGSEASEAGVKRQKFDVPRFVEQFVGNDSSFTGNLGAMYPSPTTRTETATMSGLHSVQDPLSSFKSVGADTGGSGLGDVAASVPVPTSASASASVSASVPASAFSYEQFEQLFPPQAGISNSFLFEDLLNFNI